MFTNSFKQINLYQHNDFHLYTYRFDSLHNGLKIKILLCKILEQKFYLPL
jgi:hypothetical protein